MPYFYIVHLDVFGIIIEIHCIRAGLFDKIMHDIVMHLLETYIIKHINTQYISSYMQ